MKAPVVLLALLAVSIPTIGLAQIDEPVYFDLGTVGINTLMALNPSGVFRPLDMIGCRSSAHAWAMGGAYVAHGSGMDAIAWNPAGLGWLERVDIDADLKWTTSSGTTSGYPDTFIVPELSPLLVTKYEVNLKSKLNYNQLGAGASLKPIGIDRLAAGLSVRRYLDVAFPEEIVSGLVSVGSTSNFPITFAVDGIESGGVDAMALSLAYQVLPGALSLGANLNYLDGRLAANEEILISVAGASFQGGSSTKFEYKGFATDLGVQFRREGLFALGARFTPGYTLEVSNGKYHNQAVAAPGTPQIIVDAKVSGYDMDVPSLLTLGGWVRPLPWLSAAGEFSRQKWSETEIQYTTEFPGMESNPSLPLRDVTSLNFGAEARFLKLRQMDVPLRLGYETGNLSMAQLDVKGDLLDFDWAGGDTDASGFTLGLGLETGTVTYELSWGTTDYKLKRFYYDSVQDEFINPQGYMVDIERRVNTMRLAATLAL